jgi:antitoxin MazE
MKTKVIKIGNSKGIRIPRHMLEQSGLKSEVEIEVKDKTIVLKPTTKIREDWDNAFQKMSENKDDILLDEEYLKNSTSWENEEWEW